jgi:hypothetical protein
MRKRSKWLLKAKHKGLNPSKTLSNSLKQMQKDTQFRLDSVEFV